MALYGPVFDIRGYMFTTRNYDRLVELAYIDMRCGLYSCIEFDGEEPCPFHLDNRCEEVLLEELGEVARFIYYDKDAMEALKQVAKKHARESNSCPNDT